MLVIDSRIGGQDVKINCPGPMDSEAFDQFQRWCIATGFMGLDVESMPLDVLDKANMWAGWLRGNWTRTVQFGSEDQAWVLRMDVGWQRALVLWAISDPRLKFTTWTDIDVRALFADLSVDFTAQYFDGVTLALLLNPGEYVSHKLKDTCRDFGMPELPEAEERLKAEQERLRVRRPSGSIKQRKNESDEAWAARHAARLKEQEEYDKLYPICGWNEWRDIPLTNLAFLEYAGLDAIGARRLWPLLVQACRDYGIPSDTIKLELRRQQRVVRRTIRRGMLVDPVYTQEQLDTIGAQHNAAKAKFTALTGLKAGSPFRHKWFSEQGVKFDKFTKPSEKFPQGNPSLAKEDVKDLLFKYSKDEWRDTITPEAHEGLALLREISETQNLTTFCTGLLEFMDPEHIVRPSVRILGAETGRHTVTTPAVQTLSNGNPVRGCFPAPEGWVLASIDLSQIEVRIAAALSGETRLIEAFDRGEDAYNSVAESLFGAQFTKRERSVAKRVVLATIYAGGIDTIVQQLHDIDGITVSASLVQEVRTKFRRQYRKITEYSRKMATGEDVWLYSGRYVPGDPDREYRGVNSACQGSGRDILMDCEDRACEAGYEDNIVLDIHDEILFMLPIKGLRQALLDLKRAFEVPFKGVKVTCDIEVYLERWGKDMCVPHRSGLIDAKTKELVQEWAA